MTIIRPNSIAGINSITAQGSVLNFYDSVGSSVSIAASIIGNVTGNVTGNLTGALAGTPEIAGISTTITDTAVDIFVYDTRKDSDGGAWRKRTQSTSWYNETLNTATRGARREFPAVAVIVAESGQVIIYDGDDPDLPMWMVFTGSLNPVNASGKMIFGTTHISCTSALNGTLMVGASGQALSRINFISDGSFLHWATNIGGNYNGNISERNNDKGYDTIGIPLVGNSVGINDVAMTVLPNAAVDTATGLPIPTIAVATDGGVSVIKDDGSVVDMNKVSSDWNSNLVEFFDGKLIHNDFRSGTNNEDYLVVSEIPTSDVNYLGGGVSYNHASTPKIVYSRSHDNTNLVSLTNNTFALGVSDSGQDHLALLNHETTQSQSMVDFITSTYNTGWMHGDIKRAFLSDTDATNLDASTITELVTNGTFDTDISGWTAFNSTLALSNNEIEVTRTTLWGFATQLVTMEVGKQYILTADARSNGVGSVSMGIKGSVGNVDFITPTSGTSNTTMTPLSVLFTATQTTGYIHLQSHNASGAISYFDNVSLKLAAEQDRSVNGRGLQVFGTITKTPVATGAELVGYSGWSDSNYLKQPYNSDLNFGTGDFSITVWVKPGATGNQQTLVNFLSADSSGNVEDGFYLVHYNNASGNWYFGTFEDGAAQYTSLALGSLTSTSKWYCLHVNKIGTTAYLYQDGESIGSGTVKSDISINSADLSRISLYIGRGRASGLPMGGSMSLLRISASAPSPEQIKKIYEDEKVLFQENAACTLYGSSDAVTALAYDDTTNLLHVGTSSGRSNFQRLRRINNTTTAVTTAISASNGLVAEQ